MEGRNLGLVIVIIATVLALPSLGATCAAEESTQTIPAHNGYIGGKLWVQVPIFSKVRVEWSFSADGPLDFKFEDPDDFVVGEAFDQTSASGSFDVEETGTYSMWFTNNNDYTVTVTYSLEEGESDGASTAMLGIGVFVILLVIVIAVVGVVVLRRRGKLGTGAVQEITIYEDHQYRQAGAKRVCPSCGHENLGTAEYCMGCGKYF